MKNIKTAEEITTALDDCTGTTHYYTCAFGNTVYTDGIKTMADLCGAYWLVDAVASYQREEILKE